MPRATASPIEDIQENEVEILEDGVPQKIEAFEHVRVALGSRKSSGSSRTRSSRAARWPAIRGPACS
jgi:hypothetical protein